MEMKETQFMCKTTYIEVPMVSICFLCRFCFYTSLIGYYKRKNIIHNRAQICALPRAKLI
jgi:hypothetical protein